MADDKKTEYQLHHEKFDFANELMETHKLHHSEAYNKAVRKNLKDGKRIKLHLLDEAEMQDKFGQDVADYLVKMVEEEHGHKATDDLDREVLLNAYKGTTTAQIKDLVAQYGSTMDSDFYHQQVAPSFSGEIQKTLYGATLDQLKTDDDIKGVVKEIKVQGQSLEDLLKEGQLPTREELRNVLNSLQDGKLTNNLLRRYLGKKLKKTK